jgi:hypothetical protein
LLIKVGNVGVSEMKKVPLIIIAILECLIILSVQSVSAQNWPQWRGPLATGAALSGDPPIEWSEQKNVRWKIHLSGTGHSTPAVWGNHIFVTAAKTTENDVVKSGTEAIFRSIITAASSSTLGNRIILVFVISVLF